MTKSQPQTNPNNIPTQNTPIKTSIDKLQKSFVMFAFSIFVLEFLNLTTTLFLFQEVHHSHDITTHNHNHFILDINQEQHSNSTFDIEQQDFDAMVKDVLSGGETIIIHQKSNNSTVETFATVHFDQCEVEKSAIDGSVIMMSCDVTHVVGESSDSSLRGNSRRFLKPEPMFGGSMCCGVCDSHCQCCSNADNDLCCDMDARPRDPTNGETRN